MQARLDAQQVQIDALQATIVQLQENLAAATQNSSTSSKPPSSDIVKPPKPPLPPGQTRRPMGGQPGHPLHQRPLVPPERLTGQHDYLVEFCPMGGFGLQPMDRQPGVVQPIEIELVPLQIVEHRSHAAWCPKCQTVHAAPLPAVVEHGGLAGPRLSALIAYLKDVCHASFSTIRKFLRGNRSLRHR